MVNLLEQDIPNFRSELSQKLEAKMAELKDSFEVSSFYRESWVSEDRLILRTAKNA